ncbi:hypothetical protein JM18_008792 [Phytophthora kernoviae]|uniref:Uncharacterized protein n=2 Tax=Phytophthora kernoviae TaxID=325452 RepID=A0A921SAL2_9STRA|nr:hypothetical protein G195_010058 [Phytophthora kernoviae 00238/432]KAG2510850.1 hypothetical protein JM18_008792 [Phytophthora kernoviae]
MTSERRGSAKHRKPSYLVRQDEVKMLKTKLQALKKQLATLQARPRSARAQILDIVGANAALRELIHSQQLTVAGAQSMMAGLQITISEALGHTTVREDYDTVDGDMVNGDIDTFIWNYRLLSTDSNEITSEVNKVVLTEYFDESKQMGGRPCAVVVTDSVDVDGLYPYNPGERVRRDISATTVLTEMRRKKQKCSMSTAGEQGAITVRADEEAKHSGEEMIDDGEEEEELVVVMQRAAFMKMHRPEFKISRHAMRSLKEGIASWGEVEVQSIRGAVNA